MKHLLAFIIVLNTLLVWQNCQAAEERHYEADVCVYGGTASGVMAAHNGEELDRAVNAFIEVRDSLGI